MKVIAVKLFFSLTANIYCCLTLGCLTLGNTKISIIISMNIVLYWLVEDYVDLSLRPLSRYMTVISQKWRLCNNVLNCLKLTISFSLSLDRFHTLFWCFTSWIHTVPAVVVLWLVQIQKVNTIGSIAISVDLAVVC